MRNREQPTELSVNDKNTKRQVFIFAAVCRERPYFNTVFGTILECFSAGIPDTRPNRIRILLRCNT